MIAEILKKKNHIEEDGLRVTLSRIKKRHDLKSIEQAACFYIKKHNLGINVSSIIDLITRQAVQSQLPAPRGTGKSTLRTLSSPIINIPKVQKEPNLPYGSAFIKDAYKNAEIYPYVYILENSLRKLIMDTFSSEENWWNNRATIDAKKNATKIREVESKHDWLPERGNHQIYYIGLDDLFGIISKNYDTHFKHVFSDQGNLRTWINECVPIRNLLAHNVKIKNDEKQNLILRVKYICTLIEKYHNSSK